MRNYMQKNGRLKLEKEVWVSSFLGTWHVARCVLMW